MTVSSSTNKVSYAGNSSTTVFAYTFKIFDEDDLTVIIRAANGTETTKTITTHYTVSGVGNAGGGNVTMLTAPATGETLVIIREQDLIQELDIVPNDPFPADSVEAALDKLTFMVQQQQETLNRALKASKTTTISTTEFTQSAASRANKLLSFDSNGDLNIAQELGTYRGNWAAGTAYNQRDIVKDGGNDNLYFCNTAHTSTGTLPISTNADVAKWDLLLDVSAFTTLYDQFDDRYLGAKNSDPATDNDGNTLIDGALYWNTTDNRLKVYDLGGTTWKYTAPSPAEQANIDALGPIAADISAVAADATDIGTVAADLSGADTIGTVAGIAADVTAVAAIDSDVTTVVGISADVTTVATNAADVVTVAANINSVNNFADSYVVSATEPPSPIEGMLWFDTSTDTMKVYNGSSFQNAGSSVNGTSERQTYTATSSQTTFSATYDPGFVDVYMNGVKLVDGTDFTATNGSTIVLSIGATSGDIIDIVAYGTFSLANVYTQAQSDARYVQQTHTGDVSIVGELKVESYNETYLALTAAATVDVNCEAGNVFALTTDQNTTFTFSNPPASGTAYGFTIKLTAGGTHTITWPASVDWAGGSAPDAPASGETNVLVFITHDGGTTWYGFQAGAAMA